MLAKNIQVSQINCASVEFYFARDILTAFLMSTHDIFHIDMLLLYKLDWSKT